MRVSRRKRGLWAAAVLTAVSMAGFAAADPALGGGTRIDRGDGWAPYKVASYPADDPDYPIGEVKYGPGVGTKAKKPLTSGLQYSHGSWSCTVWASDAWESGYYAYGDGWQSCIGSGFLQTALTVTLQTKLCCGFWKNRAKWSTGYTNYAWLERVPRFYCKGIGLYTYRVLTDGWAFYGTYHGGSQSLNYETFYC
jgi:hypothetical protein